MTACRPNPSSRASCCGSAGIRPTAWTAGPPGSPPAGVRGRQCRGGHTRRQAGSRRTAAAVRLYKGLPAGFRAQPGGIKSKQTKDCLLREQPGVSNQSKLRTASAAGAATGIKSKQTKDCLCCGRSQGCQAIKGLPLLPPCGFLADWRPMLMESTTLSMCD